MTDFSPRKLRRFDRFIRFEDEAGLEYEVYGDDSRLSLAAELASMSKEVLQKAERLIRSFIKFEGVYTANHCEVLAENEEDGSCALVRFTFEAVASPH